VKFTADITKQKLLPSLFDSYDFILTICWSEFSLSVCVCMCVCVCVYVHIYIYTYIHMCAYITLSVSGQRYDHQECGHTHSGVKLLFIIKAYIQR
jgi:hypothetical protein